ncbi:MAG: HAD-IA family hydrolase [Rhodospirillales bacterium]|nr:HAD-IA family hydrolase [Rhodospirillales bacterium]MCW8860943.1 HAD-IA family hydrolase [Rhodospirillales bacterium]
MIKAVFWDFGGVLTVSPFAAFRRYEREKGLPEGFLRRVNAENRDRNAWARFERNEIDLDTFDAAFADESSALGYSVPGIDVVSLLHLELRPEMVAALRTVSESFRTGCITNNVQGPGSSGANDPRADVKEVFSIFDAVIESSKAGVRKPDPKIYRIACDAIGVRPEESVFLDDLGINLKPARDMGMITIKVEEPDRALAELEAAIGLSLRA